jgi:drug/metabolite transporter (DMT)-like permease
VWGSLLAAAGAISYGVTVLVGRRLALAGLGPATVLGTRFASAGLFLLALLLLLGRPLLPARGERLAAFGLGAVLYAGESACFFLGLERGTAAAVALLFYGYPALVTLFELASGTGRPDARTLLALALAFGGTAVVVGAGERVDITPSGVGFALASAASFALYVLVGPRWLRRTDSVTSAAWVALGAGASLLGGGGALGWLRDPSGWWSWLAVNAAATASAFSFLFAALRRLGASRTSVVMTLEAFSAIVLSWVFLGETLGLLQAAGGAAVLAAAALIALGRAREDAALRRPPGQ